MQKDCEITNRVLEPEIADEGLVARDWETIADAQCCQEVHEAGVLRDDESLDEERHLLARDAVDDLAVVEDELREHDDRATTERALKTPRRSEQMPNE